jgi:hypothetical protein
MKCTIKPTLEDQWQFPADLSHVKDKVQLFLDNIPLRIVIIKYDKKWASSEGMDY